MSWGDCHVSGQAPCALLAGTKFLRLDQQIPSMNLPCRDTCSTEEFEGLVQRNIAANIGLNYASMAELCSFICERDTATLR